MVDARGGLARALHDHARQHGRERRAAVDRARSRHVALAARVGRDRIRAQLCGVHADGREARRPAGPAARVRRRSRRLHRSLSRVRSRGWRRHADRRARRPGHRCSHDEPGDALDHHRDLPAAAAGHRDRDLGRRLGARARDRPARRRPSLGARRLELDLLRQRPGGRDRDRRGLRVRRRVARHLARTSGPTCRGSSRPRSASSR